MVPILCVLLDCIFFLLSFMGMFQFSSDCVSSCTYVVMYACFSWCFSHVWTFPLFLVVLRAEPWASINCLYREVTTGCSVVEFSSGMIRETPQLWLAMEHSPSCGVQPLIEITRTFLNCFHCLHKIILIIFLNPFIANRSQWDSPQARSQRAFSTTSKWR